MRQRVRLFTCATLLVLMGGVASQSASARPIELPTFQVGGETFTGALKVAVGTDATMVFLWSDQDGDLRTSHASYTSGKLTLKSRADAYDGSRDVDKLTLACVPPG